MKDFASRMGSGVAISAAAVSVVLALFVPYGHPWASLSWAVLACAAAVWVVRSSHRLTPQTSDVISDVEDELTRIPTAAERGAASTRATS